MRHWRSTGNSNVAIQTGSTYISDSMTHINHYNSDGKPGVFDHVELVESVKKYL